MSRNQYAATTSASNAYTLKYRLLLDIDSYAAGPVRACTGGNFITVGATTYTPVGNLGGLEAVKEESDVFARALRVWMCAVTTAGVQEIVSESAYNKPVRLYRCFLTESMTLVNTPEMLFKGRINTSDMKLGDAERGNYYEISIESRLAQKARAAFLNRETHWTVFNQSGDTFFSHLPKIPLFKSQWGQRETTFDGGTSRQYEEDVRRLARRLLRG